LSAPLPVPPQEKTTARDDQAGQSIADGGAGDGSCRVHTHNLALLLMPFAKVKVLVAPGTEMVVKLLPLYRKPNSTPPRT
jgi:hypothetical protein